MPARPRLLRRLRLLATTVAKQSRRLLLYEDLGICLLSFAVNLNVKLILFLFRTLP